MSVEYQEFIENKAQRTEYHGFEPLFVPDFLFDFQREILEWATRKGRAARRRTSTPGSRGKRNSPLKCPKEM